ncbi:RlpA-like double-psi beta-barrel-protein domain-containing protein-containing protein, partial [Vararia minispora EC-137]
TFYFQGGGIGSCGQANPDSALIVAVQAQRYNPSLCGRTVQVTNTQNGRSVTATVADRCPTCQNNPNSLDLSQAAFDAIADETQGVVPIQWQFLS